MNRKTKAQPQLIDKLVTRHQFTEAAVSEPIFRQLIDLAADAIVIVNTGETIVFVNAQTEAVFGYRRDELLERPVELLMPAWHSHRHPDYCHQFLTGSSFHPMGAGLELYGQRKDGSAFPVEIRLSPIETGDGLLIAAAIRDVTERKETEKALQTYEEQLRRHTIALERSYKELDDFVYVASHDLKAPLRAIDNLATWIAEDAGNVLPTDSRHDLQLLQQRVTRMEQLLDSLLEYSRVGRINHEPDVIETAYLLQDIVAQYNLSPGFVIEVASDMPTIHAPKASLELVFRNLIGNAIKHHDRVKGRIAVSGQDAGAYVEFSVMDDGPGIAREYHDHIFQMFQTLKPRDEVEGSGMGLALVKKIVDSHGGTIGVESGKGRGACFRFTWGKDAIERK